MSVRLLTLREAALVLGCSVSTVKRRASAGALPTFVDGRLVRVREADLRRYVLERVTTREPNFVKALTRSASAGRTLATGARLWD